MLTHLIRWSFTFIHVKLRGLRTVENCDFQTECALKGPTLPQLFLHTRVKVLGTELALIKCLYLKEPSQSYYVKAYNNL